MSHLPPLTSSQPARRRTSRRLAGVALLLLASPPVLARADAVGDVALSMALGGGRMAQVYPAEYVLHHWVVRDGARAWLDLPGYGRVELLLPASEGGDGAEAYHPHDAGVAFDALLAVDAPGLLGELSIYCLPYPRAGLTGSSAAGDRIFLSPGVTRYPAEVTHMVTTHELGHVVHNQLLPDEDARGWREYRELRGITDTAVYSETAQHCDRPHEIFAEDFRYLFGGTLANYSNSIENAALPLPDAVDGLRAFMLALGLGKDRPVALALAARNFPNPFNPETRLALEADAEAVGRPLAIDVYDAAGRHVRRLFSGRLETLRFELQWDGRDDRGATLPSGAYFARIRLGDARLSHKMLLIG
ncbi:MAG: hypothetical protein H6693_13885 [Candidatus Latescibacteria bacterium]|nr:hypothetical protein [Candidatus Latescibacterota bacterium]